MKLKITDVRKVIGELITETWSPHDPQRPWKRGTPEERARIEREMGMKLRWDVMMMSAKYNDFQFKWRTNGIRTHGLLHYATGISVKDVHSTLDEGYAICIVAMSYDSPLGRPTEYWVAGYGPRPDIDDLSKMIQQQMIKSQNPHDIIGNDRLDDLLTHDFFKRHVSKIVFTEIVEFAHRMKMDIRVWSKPNDYNYVVQFADNEHMQYAVRQSQNEIKMAIYKQHPNMKVQVHVYFTVTNGVEYSILIYNKWTNYKIGIMPLSNITVQSVKDGKFTV